MPKADPTKLLRAALAAKAIDLAQYNEAMEAMELDPELDPAKFLLDRGFANEAVLKKIVDGAAEAILHPADEKTFSENFKVERMLGQGGVGRVFLALEKNIGREVAIKELIGERLGANSERAMARFLREAKISGQLEHPNIVPIYRLDVRPDGGFYYVMRHVEGRTLLHAINELAGEKPESGLAGRLRLLGDFIAVCEAMGYAHSKEIIHRDLKPSNVVIGEFGETIVLDWGLAKRLSDPETHDGAGEIEPALEGDSGELKTIAGAKLGTPPYMSPEQIDRSLGPVDAKSDVYALGVMLYLILTGEKPYKGTAREMMEKIASDVSSPSPRDSALPIPPELAAICEKAMAKKRELRFANAAELAGELCAYRDGRLVGVYAYSPMELFRRFVARNRAAVAALLTVVVSITAGLAFATHYAVIAQRERARAEAALVDISRLSEDAVELARKTVDHFNGFFETLVSNMQSIASEIRGGADAAAKMAELAARQPGIGAVVLFRKGEFVSLPADAAQKLGLPPKGIAKLEIDIPEGRFEATDAWNTADGRHAFAFVFPLGENTDDRLTVLLVIEEIMPLAFAFDPRSHPYQVWCMDSDGTIIYDENEEEIGKVLFTDAMYASYPELLALGEKIREKPWGVGYYRFFESKGQPAIYKIAAWETLSPAHGVSWKLVTAFPYEGR